MTKPDPVETWVRELNALGRKLDEEAASMHPSAWPEVLKADMDRWRELARRGPKGAMVSDQA